MILGNVSSYSHLLNSNSRIKEIEDYNELAAAVDLVSADTETKEAKEAANMKKKMTNKEQKKQQAKAIEADKQQELYPQLVEVIHMFVHSCNIDNLQKYNAPLLCNVI